MPSRFSWKKIILLTLATVFAAGLLLSVGQLTSAQAQAATDTVSEGVQAIKEPLGLPATDIRLVIAKIIRAALGLLGILALAIMLYGGYVWMTAGGNEERVGTARKILINGAIGLAIILSAYAITIFVINALVGATTGVAGHCTNGIQDGDETGVDCGGSCPACQTVSYPGSNSLYIVSMFKAKKICIRNVHPSISFNQPVDIKTINDLTIRLIDNQKKVVAGKWQYSDSSSTTVEYVANGDCGDGGAWDCLAKSSTYTLDFVEQNTNQVQSYDGKYKLNCAGGFWGVPCQDVTFVTGDNVDRIKPTILDFSIKAVSPFSPGQFYAGDMLEAAIKYTDDNGLQRANIYAGGKYLVTSTDFDSCVPSGTVKLVWSTNGWEAVKHKLDAHIFDWTMAFDSASKEITLLSQCKNDNDCVEGVCINGKCVSKTMITAVSPDPAIGGAVGTYVSISGYHFGASAGQVLVKNTTGATTTAKLADCGVGAWTDRQIIIEITSSTASSTPFTVVTDPAIPDTGKVQYSSDATNDSYGPLISNFQVNSILRPGLCKADPDSGPIYAAVKLEGKNFGIQPHEVYFGNQKAPVGYWTDKEITTNVPGLLSQGAVAIMVKNKAGYPSNGVRFDVTSGIDPTAPYIKSIEPTRGARGEYITIIGENFGKDQGQVWFRLNATGTAFAGEFTFPQACQTKVWTDTKIIVKFPKTNVGGQIPAASNYSVQVKPFNAPEASPLHKYFYLEADSVQPRPGICGINPASSPDPLPSGVEVEIIGEYFGSAHGVYFSKDGSGSTTPSNGLAVAAGQLITTQNQGDGSYKDRVLQLPKDSVNNGPKTGPVIVYRTTDQRSSNNYYFSIKSCLVNSQPDDKLCTDPTAQKCCANGTCLASNLLCHGQKRWSAYIWRFSTKDIPKAPRVAEWCEFGQATRLPSPSPNIRWQNPGYPKKQDDQYNVCRTALLTIDFSRDINEINIAKSVSNAQLIVSECQDKDYDDPKLCQTYNPITVQDVKTGSLTIATPQLSSKIGAVTTTYLQLKSGYTGAKWKNNHWYRVALLGGNGGVSAGSGADKVYLSADRPCQEVANSAYCFWFRTDDSDCALNKVIVVPYSWWTNILESPIKVSSGKDLLYGGHGLSAQNCVMMDVDGYNWKWSTANVKYSKIVGVDNVRDGIKASSLANTVGVNLINDAVDVQTVASTGTLPNEKKYSGKSPLTIDLSNPQVIDYWPNCWEACPEAEVGAQFNTSMSVRNLTNAVEKGSVQLLECFDENCFNATSTASSSDIFLVKDSKPNYTILKIANSLFTSKALVPDKIYKVIISANTTNSSSPQLLWSLNNINEPNTDQNFSKPYSREFSWRFRTKKEKCKIDRVIVLPQKYYAQSIIDRGVFESQPYSSPDGCSTQGQKLNPWRVSWQWASSRPLVATVFSTSTQGYNQHCTSYCVKKGSYVPAGSGVVPICGNNVQEAGEDCDPPSFSKGCGLNCLLTGNVNATSTTSTTDLGLCGDGHINKDKGEECDPGIPTSTVGCSQLCLRTGSKQKTAATSVSASVCGNGYIGSGEDCDLGISSDPTDPKSAMGCAQDCQHQGIGLSSYWCVNSSTTHAGFPTSTFESTCKLAYSVCGDGVTAPEEDAGCDLGNGKVSDDCDANCLWNSANKQECAPNLEGCGASGQHLGSSLLYNKPSVCGDGAVGAGEDAFCESYLIGNHKGLIDPWALGIGVGQDTVTTGTPPSQISNISSQTTQDNSFIKGAGQFIIPCGYATDSECKFMADPSKGIKSEDLGVGSNSCCYLRPKLLSVYPGNTFTAPDKIATNTCPNTAIEATFDKVIESTSLPGNFIIARGVGKNYLAAPAVIKPELANLGQPQTVYVNGNMAYVGGGNGFYLVDVNNVKQAKVISSLAATNVSSIDGLKLTSKGESYTYAIANQKFNVVDVSSTTKPQIVGSTSTPGVIYGNLAVTDKLAYIAAGAKGLRILDITSSTYPVEAGVVTPSSGVSYLDVEVSGKYAYIAAGASGLILVKVSNPSSPLTATFVSSTTGVSYNSIDLDYYGKYAYIAAGADGLRVVDISDPTKMKEVASLKPTAGINYVDVEVGINYAYVLDQNQGLVIVDITDPTKPVLAEANPISLAGLGAKLFVPINDNYAYVATAQNLSIIDIAKYSLGCSGKSDVTSLIAKRTDVNQVPPSWYKKLWQGIANFFKKIFSGNATAAGDEPIKWCAGWDAGDAQVLTFTGTTTSRVSMSLSSPLATSTHYAIILKEGIRDQLGVGLGKNPVNSKNWYWRFKTGGDICEVNKVTIDPKDVYFSKYGSTITLLAEAHTGSYLAGYRKIQPIKDSYYWEYQWDPFNLYVQLGSPTTSGFTPNLITAKNQNGEVDLRASAYIIDNKYTGKFGLQGEVGSSHVIVYLCSNPWPPKDLYTYKSGDSQKSGPYVIFPFNDAYNNNDHYDLASNTFDNKPMAASPYGGYFNFKTYYCADAGTVSLLDDLPYLRPAVQVTATVGSTTLLSAGGTLKRFLFTNEKNTDVIGIQVFANKDHLSVEDWYKNAEGFSGNVQKTVVDGYEAIKDSGGDNIYISALNYQGAPTSTLYSNIYLFSVNADATSQTKQVFNQLIENLQFNTNLTNYGYCGAAVNMGIGSSACQDDFVCTKPGEFCSQQIDKLKRNFQRLQDLAKIQLALSSKTGANTPSLAEGSLLKGQTVSTWSSWTSALASALGVTLPVDKVNKLGSAGTCKENANIYCLDDSICQSKINASSTCLSHDAITGWSTEKIPGTEDRRLSFACATNSLAFRYFHSTSTGYLIRGRFEDPFGNNAQISLGEVNSHGKEIKNWYSDFVNKFVSSSHFILDSSTGICKQGEEIVSLNQGVVCGDKVVNINKEQCDPPGQTTYTMTDIKKQCASATVNFQYNVCNANCQWISTSTSCAKFQTCGNGVLEGNEQCDYGQKNETYNIFCNKLCQYAANPSWGYCGDSKLTLPSEFCDPTHVSSSLYNLQKEKSCSSDCKTNGFYCGDGQIQTSYGEICEGSSSQACTTTVNGVDLLGTQACKAGACVWDACTTTAQTISAKVPACGDGYLDTKTEACDQGHPSKGGKNGQTCAPKYGEECSYCDGNCQVVIVGKKEWCGDGKIQGSEACEKDEFGNIYAVATDTMKAGEIDTDFTAWWNNIFVLKPAYLNSVTINNSGYVSSSFAQGYLLKKCEAEKSVASAYRKGAKDCSSVKCDSITNNCVDCGLDPINGAGVAGGIINILDPKSTNPLWGYDTNSTSQYFLKTFFPGQVAIGQQPWLNLRIQNIDVGCFWEESEIYNLRQLGKCDFSGSNYDVLLNHSPICSATPTPYMMMVNADWPRAWRFLVYSNAAWKNQPWLYDLVLSPVIPAVSPANTGYGNRGPTHLSRPNEVRIVVSWNKNSDFIGGLLVDNITPKIGTSQIYFDQFGHKPTIAWYEANGLLKEIYHVLDTTVPTVTKSGGPPGDLYKELRNYFADPNYFANNQTSKAKVEDDLSKYTTSSQAVKIEGATLGVTSSTAYYENKGHYDKSLRPDYGIWYHGFGYTDKNYTNVETFTVDISKLSGNEHAFYIRLALSSLAKNVKSISEQGSYNLKARVYLPRQIRDGEWDYYRHFDNNPSYEFNLTAAEPSANPTALNWHVFNLRRTSAASSSIIMVGSLDNGRIITNMTQIKYNQYGL